MNIRDLCDVMKDQAGPNIDLEDLCVRFSPNFFAF